MDKLAKRLPLAQNKCDNIYIYLYETFNFCMVDIRKTVSQKQPEKNECIVKIIMPRSKLSELKKSKLLCDSNYLLIKTCFFSL